MRARFFALLAVALLAGCARLPLQSVAAAGQSAGYASAWDEPRVADALRAAHVNLRASSAGGIVGDAPGGIVVEATSLSNGTFVLAFQQLGTAPPSCAASEPALRGVREAFEAQIALRPSYVTACETAAVAP